MASPAPPVVAYALLLAVALASPAVHARVTAAVRAPAVHVADVDSIIHPVSAEFMIQTLDAADRAGAALVVFTLSTPGGLVDSTRTVVTRMLAAKTPVAIFV